MHKKIEAVRAACEYADACMHYLKGLLEDGIVEKELYFAALHWMKKRRLLPAFAPIIAVDKNSTHVHYDTKEHGDGKITQGSVVMIDIGVRYDGYCSDITRMFQVGKPTTEFERLYSHILSAQKKTINLLRTERSGKKIDGFCRQLIIDNLKLDIPHSVGHGVGRKIHQKPKIGPKSRDSLHEWDIVTIEPGIYLKGKFGLRIEDTVLICENSTIEILTKSPKNPLIRV